MMETRRKSMDGGGGEPTKDQPKEPEEEEEPEEQDEENALNDEEDERPSMVEGRMMLPGVLETYNPIANSAYEEYFAEGDVELLRTEMELPGIKEAGKLDVKAFDKTGDGEDEDIETGEGKTEAEDEAEGKEGAVDGAMDGVGSTLE